ncbi:WD40 repeat-like protein [Exidia glandulosa HHB12029]|uniref:WD40 repeat-like protein n=1 Tax=Exidia glandulosa HHB12029 TaxID=1314781 RepID=A0A165EDB3_EXIGL|nr:WD40 repeat-like protein [Exidia glandulosa HHB12029]
MSPVRCRVFSRTGPALCPHLFLCPLRSHRARFNMDLMENLTQHIHRDTISPHPVGQGGYSDIYTGIWNSVYGERKVAIKVIRATPSVSTSGEMPRALRREISVWRRLLHPNIHGLCGVYEGIGPLPALVSLWNDNGDINKFVRQHAADTDVASLKLNLFAGVANGLKHLHDNHIVHGDIKGGNVLISDQGVARLCDFGLSRLLLDHSQSTTTTGRGTGTVRWMAPELLEEGVCHSFATDIWACGCLFIEVWSDVKPYHTKRNDQQVFLAHARREGPDRPPDIPDMLWLIVEACCCIDTAKRTSISHVIMYIRGLLISQRVLPTAASSRSIEPVEREPLREITQQLSEVSLPTDGDLDTEIVRIFGLWTLSPGNSGQLRGAVFQWCLAKLSIRGLHLPAGVDTPPVENDDLLGTFSASHERAMLRLLAKLVEQERPGLADQLMKKFSTPTLGCLLNIDMDVRSVTWVPDGSRIAVGCGNSHVRILDAATGTTVHRLSGHTDQVNQVAVSPNGSLVASCSNDRSIRLWDTVTGLAFGAPLVGHSNFAKSVVFSPDGTRVVSGSDDGTIRVWSTETCTPVQLGPLPRHRGRVETVAYSPDGSRIVSGSRDRTVRIWNAHTGGAVLTLDGHTGWIRSVAYSPDGLHIVSGSKDCTVRIWNVATGQQVGAPLVGHNKSVSHVAYSPDGTRIVSSSDDGTIRLWNAETRASITTLAGHTGTILSAAFSPDGKRLASASQGGTVCVWDATDEWMRWDI